MTYPVIPSGPGVTRQVLADDPALMLVAFRFEKGGTGAPHSHPHVQTTYVQSGRFAFTIDDREFEVGPGDAFTVPSGAAHSCRALEEGVLIDSFAPRRDDFL